VAEVARPATRRPQIAATIASFTAKHAGAAQGRKPEQAVGQRRVDR